MVHLTIASPRGARLTALALVSAALAITSSSACGSDDAKCFIGHDCVEKCGDVPIQREDSCEACPDGTIDTLTCPADGG